MAAEWLKSNMNKKYKFFILPLWFSLSNSKGFSFIDINGTFFLHSKKKKLARLGSEEM